MNKETLSKLKDPQFLLLSMGGIGLLPKAPGTFGSLATLPFLYILGYFNAPPLFLIPLVIIWTFVASYCAHNLQNKYQIHDPSWIVIDEFLGMVVTWLFIGGNNLFDLTIIFVLFRFFDIVKIWPANYVDKRMTNGLGTILDDIISGIYAGVCCFFILKYLNIS